MTYSDSNKAEKIFDGGQRRKTLAYNPKISRERVAETVNEEQAMRTSN